jgi:hypothetical protein
MLDWKKCSSDPIPMKAIRLSEAFEQVLEALGASPKVLETLDPSLQEYLVKNRELEERNDMKAKPPQKLDVLHRREEAVVFFRSSMRSGELTAYIRDPEDGAILQLDSPDWSPTGGRLTLLEPPYAFEEDFLDNAPFSGNPNTFIRGAYRPIFLWRKEFEFWLRKTFGRKQSGGRPPGSGSYEPSDMPFLEEMHEMLKIREAVSVHDAARRVAKDVPRRNAQEASIIRRLTKHYGRVFGLEQN